MLVGAGFLPSTVGITVCSWMWCSWCIRTMGKNIVVVMEVDLVVVNQNQSQVVVCCWDHITSLKPPKQTKGKTTYTQYIHVVFIPIHPKSLTAPETWLEMEHSPFSSSLWGMLDFSGCELLFFYGVFRMKHATNSHKKVFKVVEDSHDQCFAWNDVVFLTWPVFGDVFLWWTWTYSEPGQHWESKTTYHPIFDS